MVMTIQEAKQFLLDIGRSTCSCKYGSEVQMIELARRLKEEMENKKPPTEVEGEKNN